MADDEQGHEDIAGFETFLKSFGWSGVPFRADPPPDPAPDDGMVDAYVTLTLRYPIRIDPEALERVPSPGVVGDMTRATWHRSHGTWCGDNLRRELKRARKLLRARGRFATVNSAMNGGCMCEFIVGHAVTVNPAENG